MKRKFATLVAMMLASSLLLTACKAPVPPSDPGTTPVAPSTAKANLIMGINAEPTSLDPANAKDIITQMITAQMVDTLVKKSPEDSAKFVPGLAESWTFNADNTEILFKIRKNVKFHNGDVMTADDVLFSLDRALKSSFTSGYNAPLKSFEKVDEDSIKLTLNYAYAPIMDIIINTSFGIVSKRAVEEADAKGIDFGRNPISTGAYQFVEWVSGNKLVLKAFDGYYNGPAKINDITYRLITDANTAAISLQQKELDAVYLIQTSDWEDMDKIEGLTYLDCGSDSTHFLTFNCKTGIFSNKLLRQAVSYAINRDDIILGGSNGYGVPNECLCPTTAFGYNAEFKNNAYDPEKAKALLKEAGYPDGFKVTMRINQAATYMQPAEVVQDQLRKVGIIVEFDKMERGAFLSDVVADSKFDITLHMVNATVGDVDNVVTRKLHSSMIGNGNNYSKYVNPAVDKLIDDARVLSDPKVRQDMYNQVYEIMKEDAPIIPLFSGTNRFYMNSKIKGANPHVSFQFYIHDWYWEE